MSESKMSDQNFVQLMEFYGVDSIEKLVSAQELHIRRLQNDRSNKTLRQFLPSTLVRGA